MTRVTRLLHYWTQREALTPTNKIDMFVKRCLAGYLVGPVPSGAGVVTGGRGFGQAPPTAIKKKKMKKTAFVGGDATQTQPSLYRPMGGPCLSFVTRL